MTLNFSHNRKAGIAETALNAQKNVKRAFQKAYCMNLIKKRLHADYIHVYIIKYAE